MNFMLTVYRVTQKDFYSRPYTSMWAPVVARQLSKRYSSSCHVFISMWGVISSTASIIRCLKSGRSRNFLLYTTSLRTLCTGENFLKDVVYRRKFRDLADLRQHIIEAFERITPHMLINMWQELEYRLDICRATTGTQVRTCIKIFLSYSVHCWKHKFHKDLRY